MASYEAIRNIDDDENEDDVEMALSLNQISQSRSATVSPTIARTNNKIQEQQQHSRHQPQTKSQRLVSLDVFRGFTVAVISLLLSPFRFKKYRKSIILLSSKGDAYFILAVFITHFSYNLFQNISTKFIYFLDL